MRYQRKNIFESVFKPHQVLILKSNSGIESVVPKSKLIITLLAGCMLLAGCEMINKKSDPVDVTVVMPSSTRTLASYSKPVNEQVCYDRKKEPYTAVVDVHFHPKPFGGTAIPAPELVEYFDKLGVRFVNYFGIGQVLELDSGCTYYLDCKGVYAMPSIKNDFINGMEMTAYKHPNLHVTLSMTFMDLANPDDIVNTIKLYDKEYPGMFKWAGELNVVKQALMGNKHQPATIENINAHN